LAIGAGYKRKEYTIQFRIVIDIEYPEYELALESMRLQSVELGIATFLGSVEEYAFYLELCDANKKAITSYRRMLLKRRI